MSIQNLAEQVEVETTAKRSKVDDSLITKKKAKIHIETAEEAAEFILKQKEGLFKPKSNRLHPGSKNE